MRITRKLTLLATVPLLAVLAFAALALRSTAGQAMDAARLRSLVALGTQAGELTHQLQAERTAAAVVLSGDPGADRINAYLEQARATDQSITRYQRLRGRLRSIPGDTDSLLRTVDGELAALPGLRRQVQSDPAAELSAVTFQYRVLVADLLAYRGDVAEAGRAGAGIADLINSSVALARAEEFASEQELAVVRARAAGGLTPVAQEAVAATRTGYTEAVQEFGRTADPDWRAWLDRALAGDAILDARRMEDAVARSRPGDRLPAADAWTAAMGQRVDRLQEVEQRIDGSVLATVTAYRDDQRGWTLAESLAVLLAVAAVVLTAVRLGRPMIRELRRLRDAAHEVAHERLPATVSVLRTRGALGEATPEEFAAAAGDPVEVRGRDEIAEVGTAFNTVSREAVRIAAEQAAMRDRLGSVLVGLARRGERLTGALMQALDEAERNEHDPARLERLFALDHLATRMGRNNHSLLVLGGEASARVRGQDAPVEDVLRAATGQIERYTRVDVGLLDAGVLIRAGAVDHLVHLFAELLDNATAFSRPEHRVSVEARLLADRVAVLVCDHGLGLAEDQWEPVNARLADPPPVEVAGVRAMGLGVVGQIASWYGVRVELRPRPGGGTIVEVTLPAEVFRIAPAEPGQAPEPPAPLPAPDLTAPDRTAPAPTAVPAAAAPVAAVAATTAAGLPQRRPRAGGPALVTAEAAGPGEAGARAERRTVRAAQTVRSGLPDERRDPAMVSAAMAAYARGIGASRTGRATPTPLPSGMSSDPEQKEEL